MLTLSAVPAEEAAPFYKDFLAAFPDGRVGIHLHAQAGELEELCAGLTESGARFRYAEGKWTIKEVIGHLLDTERVFAYRLLRISRGDVTELPGFDETTYAPEGQFNQRGVEELVSEFKLQRAMAFLQPHGLVSGLRMVSAPALGHLSTSFWGTARIIIVSSESVIGCPRHDDQVGLTGAAADAAPCHRESARLNRGRQLAINARYV